MLFRCDSFVGDRVHHGVACSKLVSHHVFCGGLGDRRLPLRLGASLLSVLYCVLFFRIGQLCVHSLVLLNEVPLRRRRRHARAFPNHQVRRGLPRLAWCERATGHDGRRVVRLVHILVLLWLSCILVRVEWILLVVVFQARASLLGDEGLVARRRVAAHCLGDRHLIALRESGRGREDILRLLWGLAPIQHRRRHLLINGLQGQTRHVPILVLLNGTANFVLTQLGDHLLLSLVEVPQVSGDD